MSEHAPRPETSTSEIPTVGALTMEQALATLTKMREAAPPVAASRLQGVMTLLTSLQDENALLNASLSQMYDSAPALNRTGGTGWLNTPAEVAAEDSDEPPATSLLNPRAKAVTQPLDGAARAALMGDTADGSSATAFSPLNAADSFVDLFTRLQEGLSGTLVGIRAGAGALEQREMGRVLPEQREAVTSLRARAEYALQLLDSVTDMVRLETGTFDLRLSDFAADDLVRAAAAGATLKAKAQNHRLLVQPDENLPPLHADLASALVILGDILDNAMHYTPYGGTIRLTAVSLGQQVLITVEDNGIGLSADDLAQVGQPFWRGLHQPLVRARAGTGLRLYLARRVLEMMGGELFFSSDSGMGSSFSLLLPVAGERSAAKSDATLRA